MPREQAGLADSPGAGAPEGPPSAAAPPGSDEEMAALAAQLLAAPVEDVIANHCYGLFELAALHLSQQPPNLDSARKAIDAMGCLVEGLGSRLGQHQGSLSEGLTQLRLAWVKLQETVAGPAQDGRESSGGEPGAGSA